MVPPESVLVLVKLQVSPEQLEVNEAVGWLAGGGEEELLPGAVFEPGAPYAK